jgi:hypothetical protein
VPGLGGGLEPALALQEEGRAVQRTDVAGVELEPEPPVGERAIRIRAEVSRAIAFLNRIPRFAPGPVPPMIAGGIARPRASGQVSRRP